MTDYDTLSEAKFRAAHPADSAEALLRRLLDALPPFFVAGPYYRLNDVVKEARAALQASAPSPAAEPPVWCVDPLEHGRFCPCPIPAAAEGSEPLDVDGVIAELMGVEGSLDQAIERLRTATLTLQGIAAYASQTSEPVLVDEISLVDLGGGWYRFTASANTQDVAAIGRAAAAFAPREVSDPDLSEGWDPTAGAG